MLDIRTIIFIYVVTNAVCAAVMASLWLRNRDRFDGLGFWLADFAMQFLALVLVALRGAVPDFLSIVVSNTLAIAGTILLYMGLERFLDRRSSQLHNYIFLSVFIIVHTYYAIVQPSLLIRTINLSIGIILVCAQCAWLLRYRVDNKMRPVTLGLSHVFLTFSGFSLARIFVDLVVSPGNDFFRSSVFEALAVLVNQTLFIILTFALLLMVNRRLVAILEHDIVERSRTEGALRHSEALLAQTGKVAKVGGWELDLHTMTPRWSLETYRIHEIDPSYQPDLENAINYYAPEARPLIREAVERAIEQGQSYDLELPFITAKGREIWVRSIGQAEFRDGKCAKLFGTFQDITERKRAVEELDKRTRELNAILSSVQDYVYIFDPEGRFVFANKRLLDLWGLTAEQTIGKTMRDLNYPEAVETALVAGMRHVLETEHTTTNITHYTSPSGAVGSYENILSPMLGPDNKVAFVAGSSRDITERELAQAEIESLSRFPAENPNPILRVQNDGQVIYANPASRELLDMWGCGINEHLPADMKDLVAAAVESGSNKTVDIPCNGKVYWLMVAPVLQSGYVNLYGRDITARKHAEQELERTLDKLKQSNTELEEFAYVASHDLQEPLRGIAGLAQLLQRRYQGQLDGRADEYIKHIVEGTQRMQTLINDLLAYSRVGRLGKVPQTTEADSALKAALKNLNAAILEVGASITNEDMPRVKADATQLTQVFQNLIGNAIKFRSKRPPQIHIGIADAGDSWQFSVRDNGIGIEPQYFQRVFVVFQRLHTRLEYKGAGIGLAICKKIIERHNGHIWVESEEGQGSTFHFTLPKG